MVRGKRFPGLVVAVLASCAPLVMGCESRVAQRGNLPDAARVAELKPGNIGRDEILEILGSPSSVNTFGSDQTWYYISERTETFAFFEPKVMERQVLIVKFDKSANLKSLEILDAKAGRRLAHVERVTPTFGQELTVIGQILGNFRRFTGANDPANQ